MKGGELWAAGGHDKSIFNLGASQIPDRLQQRDMTDLDKTRSVLALTAAPRSLSCRESERDTIAAFVTETVQAGKFNCFKAKLILILRLCKQVLAVFSAKLALLLIWEINVPIVPISWSISTSNRLAVSYTCIEHHHLCNALWGPLKTLLCQSQPILVPIVDSKFCSKFENCRWTRDPNFGLSISAKILRA